MTDIIYTISQKYYNADFTALYVDTTKNLSQANKLRLEENTAFVKNQGAKIVTLAGHNIPFLVDEYAKERNVTKRILGLLWV